MTRRQTVVLVVIALVGGWTIGWLGDVKGWTRLVGTLLILAALCVVVVIDSRPRRDP